MSMIDPSILDTSAYRVIKDDWLKEATVVPEYFCDICLQWYKMPTRYLQGHEPVV